MELKWKVAGGNDLVVEFKCECPSALFIGTNIEHLMKQKIDLWGYADANFFDNVNSKPRNFKCKCGKEYSQQWFTDGKVIVETI